jgi:hypothetical protein
LLLVPVVGASTVVVPACGDDDGGAGATTTAGVADTAAVIDPGDGGDYAPDIDPASFVEVVDNPYFPMLVGSRWVYEGEADGETERVEIVVTDQRKNVMGIAATVVRDSVYVEGELVEDTFDWFAQDRDGNVWYLGEATESFDEHGASEGTEGSFEHGVDGAYGGIVMLADPQVGDAYRQEYRQGEAEDLGEVMELGTTASVPFGDYQDVLRTRDWNPLEPDVIEEKYYAPGIGVVLETVVRGDGGPAELLDASVA